MSGIQDFDLKNDQYIFKIIQEEPSFFDTSIINLWKEKMDQNIFRYKLKIDDEKILSKYGFVLQLNPLRSEKRRKPEVIQSTKEPFNDDKFNFTMINKNEIMFKIENDYIAINDSPIDNAHSLLLPDLYAKQPQILTLNGLKFATKVILSSSLPSLRVGFNGLCAFASINHLHFHIYYLKHRMMLESVPVKHISGNCYYQDVFPSKGYVFQIKSMDDINPILEDVLKLADYFNLNNIAHNLIMTRGTSFNQDIKNYDSIRIYLWPRVHSSGCKDINKQNPALCELFGHFPMKDKESYDNATEEDISDLLKELTSELFDQTIGPVECLFNKDIKKYFFISYFSVFKPYDFFNRMAL